MKTGPNALSPHLMSPAERRAELCQILAAGLLRLIARERKFSEHKELSESFRLHNGEKPCGRHHNDPEPPA